jgi:hypothetical protein
MPLARQGQRSVNVPGDARDERQKPFRLQFVDKQLPGLHRPHRMGTGRTYSDLENIENAQHGFTLGSRLLKLEMKIEKHEMKARRNF